MTWTPVSAQEAFTATYYHPMHNGGTMFCGGTYWDGDQTIVAVGSADYSRFPCWSQMTVAGPAGSITVTVQDHCGGCRSVVDLSRSANEAVCGAPAHTCLVSVSAP